MEVVTIPLSEIELASLSIAEIVGAFIRLHGLQNAANFITSALHEADVFYDQNPNRGAQNYIRYLLLMYPLKQVILFTQLHSSIAFVHSAAHRSKSPRQGPKCLVLE